jgi:hypothetical protein
VELYCTHPDIAGILEIYAKRGIPPKTEAASFLAEMFEPFSIGK